MNREIARAMVVQIDEMIEEMAAMQVVMGQSPLRAGALAAVAAMANFFMTEPELLYDIYDTWYAPLFQLPPDVQRRQTKEKLRMFMEHAEVAVERVKS